MMMLRELDIHSGWRKYQNLTCLREGLINRDLCPRSIKVDHGADETYQVYFLIHTNPLRYAPSGKCNEMG